VEATKYFTIGWTQLHGSNNVMSKQLF